MIKKTKLTAALLTAAMVLQLAACGSNAASGLSLIHISPRHLVFIVYGVDYQGI